MVGVIINPFTGDLQLITTGAVKKAGDTMQGTLVLANHPVGSMDSVTKLYTDELGDYYDRDVTINSSAGTLTTGSTQVSTTTFTYVGGYIKSLSKTDSTNTKAISLTRNASNVITTMGVTIT